MNWALLADVCCAALAAGLLQPHLRRPPAAARRDPAGWPLAGRGPHVHDALCEPAPWHACPAQPGGDSAAFGVTARGGRPPLMRDPWGRPL